MVTSTADAVRQPKAPRADCCATCRFSRGVTDLMHLVCRRYPATLNKHAADWCGEFSVKKA